MNKFMNQSTEENLFSTRDIYLASTLLSLKFQLVGIDYQIEGEKRQPVGYFKFKDGPGIRDIESRYWQGLLSVEPKQFITNIRSLKAQVSNTYKNPHSEYNK